MVTRGACASRGLALVLALSATLAWSITGCFPPSNNNGHPTGKYVGAATCRACHSERHAEWSATSHAKALETLEAEGFGNDPECLLCHTVGYLENGGYVDRATTNGLAGVQCENCHGPGRDHAEDPNNESLRLPRDIAGYVCGACHTGCQCHRGSTHQNYQLWKDSGHGEVEPNVAAYFTAGEKLNECGECHSGDFRQAALLDGDAVADDMLAGKSAHDMNGITCANCHNPHARTGNASDPYPNWDFQLRYPDTTNPMPSNSAADSADPNRFNVCGQCHHSDGVTWQQGDTGPHGSVQANVFVGEMPMPPGQEGTPLVANTVSMHSDVVAQCCACHMYTKDEEGAPKPTEGGHTFLPTMEGCGGTDCHTSAAEAQAITASLQEEVQDALDEVAAALGDPNAWEYTDAGGPDPAGQAALSDEIKKARFLYHYVIADGSRGVHNPDYVRAMLNEAKALLGIPGP